MEQDFANVKRLVIKVGSSLLVENGKIREMWLESLMRDVSALLVRGVQVVIVSSGSIALGRVAFDGGNGLTIAQRQAAAALGQIQLMAKYQRVANGNGFEVAQILLTHANCADREGYNNLQNVFAELLARKIVPIINENDSVALDEIIGDNDRLAARVAQIVSADSLVLFSDIDGLYDKNPRTYDSARFIARVERITQQIESMAGGVGSSVGTGGMITKITAAKMAVMSGCDAVITSGLKEGCLSALLLGGQRYTIFLSDKESLKARKKWLAGFLNAKGEVVINKQAVAAFAMGRKISLLPIGIVKINGNFNKNDLIFIKDEFGNHIASGIANYSCENAQKVLGKNSDEVREILGEIGKTELVHIDNLVIN